MAAMVMPCHGLGWPIGDRVVNAFLHREGYCFWTVKVNTWWFVFSLAVFAFASEFGSNIIVHCVIGGGFVAVACTALLYRKPLTIVGLAMAVSYLWQRYLFFLPMPTNPYLACTMLIIMGVASVLFLQTTRNRLYCACVAFGIRLGAVIGAVWTRPSDNGVAIGCGAVVFAAFVCSAIAQRWCPAVMKNNNTKRSWEQVYVSGFFFQKKICCSFFIWLFSFFKNKTDLRTCRRLCGNLFMRTRIVLELILCKGKKKRRIRVGGSLLRLMVTSLYVYVMNPGYWNGTASSFSHPPTLSRSFVLMKMESGRILI
jgi:hypothetical protein